MDIVWVALSALVGGLLAALLGWADSKEAFDGRKFIKSTLAALFSAVAFAVAYSFSGAVGPKDLLLAFLSGAGVDALSNRIMGAVRGR